MEPKNLIFSPFFLHCGDNVTPRIHCLASGVPTPIKNPEIIVDFYHKSSKCDNLRTNV